MESQLKAAPSMSFPLASKTGSSYAIDERSAAPDSGRSNGSNQLDVEVSKWKNAYEAAVAENERLRSRGEEANQASQWRDRFEVCERERNEALDRLQALLEPHSRQLSNSGSSENIDHSARRNDLLGPAAIYQRYLSLKEEFEVRYTDKRFIFLFSL